MLVGVAVGPESTGEDDVGVDCAVHVLKDQGCFGMSGALGPGVAAVTLHEGCVVGAHIGHFPAVLDDAQSDRERFLDVGALWRPLSSSMPPRPSAASCAPLSTLTAKVPSANFDLDRVGAGLVIRAGRVHLFGSQVRLRHHWGLQFCHVGVPLERNPPAGEADGLKHRQLRQ